MTLNHSKSIETVEKKEMHTTTILLDDLMSYTTPACFGPFFDLLWSLL